MEPDAIKLMGIGDKSSDMVGLSIAISLKRIADALTPQGELTDEDDRTKWNVHALLFGIGNSLESIEQSLDA